MTGGWIGVDLDGTLAVYGAWEGPEHIGAPIPPMVERVRLWLAQGRDVRIFTARVSHDGTPARAAEAALAEKAITEWCVRIFGKPLAVTCAKDFAMIELWDDRCVQVVTNTGARADGKAD